MCDVSGETFQLMAAPMARMVRGRWSEAEGSGEKVKLVDVENVSVGFMSGIRAMPRLEFADVFVDTCCERSRDAASAHADAGGLSRLDADEGEGFSDCFAHDVPCDAVFGDGGSLELDGACVRRGFGCCCGFAKESSACIAG